MKIHSLVLLVLLALGTGLAVASAQTDEAEAPRQPVTVFVLRHAEKVQPPVVNDSGLTTAGEDRAAALARLLAAAGVTHVFSSEAVRTQSTVAPLAAARKLQVTVISARDGGRQLAALRALPPGSVAVVAGHSNTVPRLVEGLGGEVANLVETPPYGGILADDSFDRLFLVTLPTVPEAVPRAIELRYGD